MRRNLLAKRRKIKKKLKKPVKSNACHMGSPLGAEERTDVSFSKLHNIGENMLVLGAYTSFK